MQENEENEENSENIQGLKMLNVILSNLINVFSFRPKSYAFYKLYEYYMSLQNHYDQNLNINEMLNRNNQDKEPQQHIENIDNIEENENEENEKDESNNISLKKYNTYLYESLSEPMSENSLSGPNSEGNDRLHKLYELLQQQNNQEENNLEEEGNRNEYEQEQEQEYEGEENEDFQVQENENEENNIEFEHQENGPPEYNSKDIKNEEIPEEENIPQEEEEDHENFKDENNNESKKEDEEDNEYIQENEAEYSPNNEDKNPDSKNGNNFDIINNNFMIENISNENEEKEKDEVINEEIEDDFFEENKESESITNRSEKKDNINDLNDVQSNKNSEKEADLDDNMTNNENFQSPENSNEEKETDLNNPEVDSNSSSKKEEEEKNNENDEIKEEENKKSEKNEKNKEKNFPGPSFDEMRNNINEVKKGSNNMRDSLTNNNDINIFKKILNDGFRNENENLKIKNKINDSSSQSSNKDKSNKHSKKSSSEEEEEEDTINMAGLGYFVPFKNKKKDQNNQKNEKIEIDNNRIIVEKNEKKDEINKNRNNIPLKKEENENNSKTSDENKNMNNSNNSEENKNGDNKNIINIYFKPKPQSINDILKINNNIDKNIIIDDIKYSDNKGIDDKDNESASYDGEININNKNVLEADKDSLNLKLYLSDKCGNNRRYTSEDELTYNNNTYSERRTEEDINNEKIIKQLTEEMENNLKEEITNEILDEILSSEITEERNIIKKKKDLNTLNTSINSNSNTPNNRSHKSTSPVKNQITKESNLSACSSSPGRNKSKSVNTSNNLVNNRYNNFLAISAPSIRDEDSLINTSVFMKTVQEIKKDEKLCFYDKKILPKFLDVIKNNITKKYYEIIKELNIPLKIDEEKLMMDLSSQITFKKINDKNSKFDIDIHYLNEKIKKKIFLDEEILTKFNEENNCEENIQNLNKCIFDAVNELIQNKRIYGKLGEPLSWSLRTKEIEYKYKDTRFFKDIFANNIIKEINDLTNFKLGLISENQEHLNSSQISKDREIKFNKSINKELKQDERWGTYEEEETIVKLMATKIIMNQLLNEVVEILEHVQFSRKRPEKYNFKSIFSCENIPLLSFQNELANRMNKKVEKISEEEEEDEEDDGHKSEDRTNQ